MSDLDDTVHASTLLRFALTAQPPGRSREHRDLVTRYRTDAAFRRLVGNIAHGLGIDVLDVSDLSGLVLAPQPGSPFTSRIEDLTGDTRGVEDRLLFGLAWLGIATYCYPSPSSLERDDEAVFTIDQVSEHITDQCTVLEADWDGVEVDEDHLRTAWRAWLAIDPTNPTASGTLKKYGSRAWYLHQTVKVMVDHHLVLAMPVDGQFRTTARLRVQLREAGNELAVTLFRSAASRSSAEAQP
jgi:hypothetical protein